MASSPQVFILESLDRDDEKNERFEGRILCQHLRLALKKPRYEYFRTELELRHLLSDFSASGYRYLHLSCHANRTTMGMTYGDVSFRDLGSLLRPVVFKRRVFLSACRMASENLAEHVMNDSSCYSIVGPSKDVAFADAAILWASFYHLMFSRDSSKMKRSPLLEVSRRVARTFNVPLNCFVRSRNETGHELVQCR